MIYALCIVAGVLAGIPLSGWLFGRWIDEEGFRGYLRRLAARRGWDWLLETVEIGEALGREFFARQQVAVLAEAIERLKALSYHDRLYFGPVHDPLGEQLIRIEVIQDEDGRKVPVLVVSGRGPWVTIPIAEATPERVLYALGPVKELPELREYRLGWLLARVPDEELQALPPSQRTALVHALLRDGELPGVVEGLVDRFQKAKAVAS